MSEISPNELSVSPELNFTQLEEYFQDAQSTKAKSQQIRAKVSGDGESLKIESVYIHDPNKRSRPFAILNRIRKYRNGATVAKNTLTHEFGEDFVAKLTKKLNSSKLFWKNVDLNKEVKVKDLPKIRKAIDALKAKEKALSDAKEKALSNAHEDIQEQVAFTQSLVSTLQSDCASDLETMCDDIQERQRVANLLDDPQYSKDNFVGCVVNQPRSSNGTRIRSGVDANSQNDKPTFTAKFKGGLELTFSNRISTKRELRGPILKQLLENSNYGNLRELIESTHNSEKDTGLIYAASALTNTIGAQIINMWDKHPGFSTDDAKALWNRYKDLKLKGVTLAQLNPLDIDTLRVENDKHRPASNIFKKFLN